MDRRERIDDLNVMLLAALQGERADIWTAIPGIVQKFDPVAMTCEVQPSIRFRINPPALNTYTSPTMTLDPSGQFAWDKMPVLLDCPVVFPGGGGVTLTFPIAVGDEVLMVFASRCIDAWWQQGGIQNQNAVRMHDLSDGFVIPQVRSQKRRFTVSTSAAQLRSDDGSVVIELHASAKTLHLTAPNGAVIDANTTINGNLQVNGTIVSSTSVTAPTVRGTTDVVFGSKSASAHVHSGVQGGSSNTGGPV